MLSAVMAAAAVLLGPAPQVVIDAPHWVGKPTANDVAAAYPLHAQHADLSGRAELECLVAADGRMDRCRVFAETPIGERFGDAALELAPKFRLEMAAPPQTGEAATIYIPIRFQIVRFGSQTVAHPASDPMVMTAPRWARAPTFEDVGHAFPSGAKAATGDVTLRCRIEADGAPSDCVTRQEQPAGQGFAGAAQALTSRFRVDFGRRPARPQDDFVADLKFHFSDPKDDDFLGRRIAQPSWLTLPDPDQAAALFPAAASAKGVTTGRGLVQCDVAPDGSLRDCVPQAGDPYGLGFSEAAVKAASAIRMNPWTDAGGPVNGARVQLPIRFDRPAQKRADAGPASADSGPLREVVFPRPDSHYAFLGPPGPYFPDRAARMGVGGMAILNCEVGNEDRLQKCRLVEDSPAGLAFGLAALRMAETGYMRAKPVADVQTSGPSRFQVSFPTPSKR
ncbi:MAG TPA: TonB family protein [Caulobacteraceae bacterium]|nr:TonB family protein [Caulobacteraceae bacterium]